MEQGGRRTDAAFLTLFAMFALLVVGVDVFSVAHERAEVGRPLPIWEPAVWELTSWVALIGLAPLVLSLIRRAPPRRPPALAWVGIHLGAVGLFSLVHVLAMGSLRYLVYAAAGRLYDPLGPLADWVYELRKDALAYCGLVVLYRLWKSTGPPDPAPTVKGPGLLEIRDGTRRRYLPRADIAWIEAAGNYVEIHGAEGVLLHRASLADMERLLAGEGFVRIHRSRLVRRAAIRAVETSASGDFTVSLASGETLGGSRRYRSECLVLEA